MHMLCGHSGVLQDDGSWHCKWATPQECRKHPCEYCGKRNPGAGRSHSIMDCWTKMKLRTKHVALEVLGMVSKEQRRIKIKEIDTALKEKKSASQKSSTTGADGCGLGAQA